MLSLQDVQTTDINVDSLWKLIIFCYSRIHNTDICRNLLEYWVWNYFWFKDIQPTDNRGQPMEIDNRSFILISIRRIFLSGLLFASKIFRIIRRLTLGNLWIAYGNWLHYSFRYLWTSILIGFENMSDYRISNWSNPQTFVDSLWKLIIIIRA